MTKPRIEYSWQCSCCATTVGGGGGGGGAHCRITIFTFILTVTLSTIIFAERTNQRHVNRQAIKKEEEKKKKKTNYNVLTK